MEHENGAIVRRFIERVFEQGDLDAIGEFVADEFTNFNRREDGREAWRRIAVMWRTAFPDVRFPVEDEIVHGDKVVQRVRMRGTHLGELRHPSIGTIPATGRSFDVDQIHIWRVVGGRIAEHWGTRNDLKMLQQLGVAPAPDQPNWFRY
jgi:predicted ester cyclase